MQTTARPWAAITSATASPSAITVSTGGVTIGTSLASGIDDWVLSVTVPLMTPVI